VPEEGGEAEFQKFSFSESGRSEIFHGRQKTQNGPMLNRGP
jgi:hypothetical protein